MKKFLFALTALASLLGKVELLARSFNGIDSLRREARSGNVSPNVQWKDAQGLRG